MESPRNFIKVLILGPILFVRNIIYKLQMKKSKNIVCLEDKTCMFLPEYDSELIQYQIFESKQYYDNDALCEIWNKYEEHIKVLKGSRMLDIGANIGNHALFFMKHGADILNYCDCFEPIKDTFNILKKNIELNSLENRIHLHNLGVGAKKSEASIKFADKSNRGSTTLVEVEGEGSIQICDIDSFGFKEVCLAKIDVEGFELEVLKGMINTLRDNSMLILIEIREQFYDECKSILENCGYHLLEKKGSMDYIFSK